MSHHFVPISKIPAGGEKLDVSRLSKLTGLLKLVAVVGALLSAGLFLGGQMITLDSQHFVTHEPIHYTLRDVFSYSWLFAFVAVFTLALGSLFWVLLHNASNSGWGVAVRRLPETLAVQLPLIGLLGLPLLFPSIRETLWQWIHDHAEITRGAGAHHGESLKEALHHTNHLLYHKLGYLSIWWGAIPGWLPRYGLYFVVLGLGAWILRSYSVSQDQTGNVRPTLSARRFSCGWLPLFAVCLTFASFDWVKSLNYAWFSTMFGVNFFAGSALAGMALWIVITVTMMEAGYFRNIVTPEHLHIMGKLMHAFTIFWAYIAFSQFFLIWYANIAEETQFYAIRNTGGWNYYAIFLLTIGHFILPFVLLLTKSSKVKPRTIRAISLWIIFVHLAEIYWFIIPERGPKLADQPSIMWAIIPDLVAFATIGSIVALGFIKSLSQHSIYPCGDPRLQESINVKN